MRRRRAGEKEMGVVGTGATQEKRVRPVFKPDKTGFRVGEDLPNFEGEGVMAKKPTNAEMKAKIEQLEKENEALKGSGAKAPVSADTPEAAAVKMLIADGTIPDETHVSKIHNFGKVEGGDYDGKTRLVVDTQVGLKAARHEVYV